MDNIRTFLWALLGSMAFLTWAQWQDQHAPPPVPVAAVVTAPDPAEQLPGIDSAGTETVATTPPTTPQIDAPATPQIEGPAAGTISVDTDVFALQISLQGGNLVNSQLKKYPVSKDTPNIPVQLLNSSPDKIYVIASGIVDGQRDGPTHLTTLSSPAQSYTMTGDTLEVPLSWTGANGVRVEKIYRFKRGQYAIELEYRIQNNSDSDWRALSYLQMRRRHNPPERSMFDVDSYSYDGGIYYDGEKYEKVDPDDLEETPLNLNLTGGWVAFIEHHFLAAAIPAPDVEYTYDATYSQGNLTLRTTGPAETIPAGSSTVINSKIFVGPKLQNQLAATAPDLQLTVDYGILALVSAPLFWLLDKVHSYVGNWGWAIIIVTLLIKLAFYKLTEASGRSMAKMRKLQPRLKALQERYKDDRQALSQQMMELYKREKVNPAAGCLPMLIQIPFFIAFYWVLLESVEMRQAPFALWINDLSSRDPFFVLPLLMGIAMFIQQKLNPAPPDPVQAKVMSILPVMFTVFFAFFPAGLVLYWLSNSVLSIMQQWNINRRLGANT